MDSAYAFEKVYHRDFVLRYDLKEKIYYNGIITTKIPNIISSMSNQKPRKGFAPVIIVMIVLAVSVAGVGGYFAYSNLIAPMLNPYAGLIPDGLKEYAKGANADGFIVIKKNDEIGKIIKGYPILPAMVNDIQSVLVLMKASTQTIVAIAQFSDKDSAKAVADLIKSQESWLKIKLEQKDKVIIASVDGDMTTFTGSLLDNPNIKNLDPAFVDSQLIVSLDTTKMTEATSIPFNLLNSLNYGGGEPSASAFLIAHAQADFEQSAPSRVNIATDEESSARQTAMTSMNYLFALSKNCFIYLRLKGDNLSGKMVVNFMAKNEIAASPLVTVLKSSGVSGSTADLEKAYDEAIKGLKDNLPELQKQADTMQKQLPGSNVKIAFEGTTLQMNFNAPFSELQKQADEAASAGPKRARDVARKANLNSIISALETYNADNNAYPTTSGCLETLTGLETYFMNKKLPVDPNGAQKFGETTCTGGYYYQYFPSKEYVVWAKVENLFNGNTDITPAVYAADPEAAIAKDNEKNTSTPAKPIEGTYFSIHRGVFGDENYSKPKAPEVTSDVTNSMTNDVTNNDTPTSDAPVRRVRRTTK